MNALFVAAVDIQAWCAGRGWKCCVIGGLAVQRWGEPRQTRDVDLTLLTGLGREEQFIDPILAHYPARLPDARRFALDHRVLLVETANGIPLDISLGGLPYEARVVERSTEWEVEPAVFVTTCSAEDLLVLKAFAGRAQDWLDVEGVVVRQARRLGRQLVLAELRPLLDLKEDHKAGARLLDLFSTHPA
ncbi:MAG: nucleotidyl transferase AbiEii/AbiGii toxin family protein [Acidobacteriota bacterium]